MNKKNPATLATIPISRVNVSCITACVPFLVVKIMNELRQGG